MNTRSGVLLACCFVLVSYCLPVCAYLEPYPHFRYEGDIRPVMMLDVPGKGSGSGVVIDSNRQLIATCWHVASMQNKMDGYFAAGPNGTGKTYNTPGEYRNNKRRLREIGAHVYTFASAHAPDKDISILYSLELGSDVPAIKLASGLGANALAGETIHLIGNPGGYEPFWWSKASIDSTTQIKSKYQGVKQSFKGIVYSRGATLPGSSGGPALNSDGELIGIQEANQDEIHTTIENGIQKKFTVPLFSIAVHVEEVKVLLDSIKGRNLVKIKNQSSSFVSIKWQWQGASQKNSVELSPGQTHLFENESSEYKSGVLILANGAYRLNASYLYHGKGVKRNQDPNIEQYDISNLNGELQVVSR